MSWVFVVSIVAVTFVGFYIAEVIAQWLIDAINGKD